MRELNRSCQVFQFIKFVVSNSQGIARLACIDRVGTIRERIAHTFKRARGAK